VTLCSSDAAQNEKGVMKKNSRRSITRLLEELPQKIRASIQKNLYSRDLIKSRAEGFARSILSA